jgi:phospholipase C
VPKPLLFDWLDQTNPKVPWRVFDSGLSFYSQWLSSLGSIISPPSNRFDFTDLVDHARADILQGVTFVEPLYQDDVRQYNALACDDHPPASIWSGQTFLKKVYEAIAASPKWDRTLLIITYDEHGSFFDHVPPQDIPAAVPTNANYATGFATTGLRVPAIVISPFVKVGGVCHTVFDHTSILKLLGEKYNAGFFNNDVKARPDGMDRSLLENGLKGPGW